MTDEEKQAIEYLKSRLYGNEGCKFIDVAQSDLRIFINLIEKQSKEIEYQIEKRENQRNELAILNAKQVEFNKLVNTLNSYKGQFKRQQKEIEGLKDTRSIFNMGRRSYKNEIENKIKVKIESVDYSDYSKAERIAMKEVLQSLLEKGK